MFKKFLSILFFGLPIPASSEVVQVWVMVDYLSAPFPIDSRIEVFKNGQLMGNVKGQQTGMFRYTFDLDTCEGDIRFRVISDSPAFKIDPEYYDCKSPDVMVMAEISTIYASVEVDAQPQTSGIYTQWINTALTTDQAVLAAMGAQANGNQIAIFQALSTGDMGEVAFYANENAALARKAAQTSAALGYATLSYDSGYRAMGLDPESAVPLVMLDASQNNIPVLTDAGGAILQKFNQTAVTTSSVQWTGATTRALRFIPADPQQTGLLQIDSAEQAARLVFDPSGRALLPAPDS
ncbi:hypothetical protein [Puniceibacterium sp. IMCC21224]|uniref:hypothetical protein n=1 Tax=Puniceibacterium sp. IMCC21224 TaxID=1618204 RepID=UPI00064E0B32|nr:hypothetical protein [Puniceibacterium sp. IMCC21224]KMK67328.1 hypothetical protein IMCC21224_112196 [Puniceibacterium sp. IMCC21224]